MEHFGLLAFVWAKDRGLIGDTHVSVYSEESVKLRDPPTEPTLVTAFGSLVTLGMELWAVSFDNRTNGLVTHEVSS